VSASRRLFVAASPPDAVRRRIGALVEALRAAAGPAAAGLRFAPLENVHATLQFLGAVPEERVAGVAAAVSAAASSAHPLALEVRGAGGFPTARRPRVVWLGLAGDVAPLAALAAELGRRLGPLGFPPEDRPFSPHLTIARARHPRGASGLGAALASLAAAEPVPWRVGALVLVESRLGPRGPRYEAILRAALGEAP